MSESQEVVIYSDGACKGNPGPGGWAAILVRDGHHVELGGREPQTTNNRMEMTGALEGLKQVKPGEKVRIVTDSKYLLDGATKWIHGWKRRGWTKSDGEPVLNPDLWMALDEQLKGRKVKWEHVKGHAGHPENERCDEIAQGFAQGNPPELKSGDGAWIAQPKAKAAAKTSSKAAPKTAKVDLGPEESYEKPLYLSLVDGDIQDHPTWAACEARIKGVRGARCKKVVSKREHVAALVAWKDLI